MYTKVNITKDDAIQFLKGLGFVVKELERGMALECDGENCWGQNGYDTYDVLTIDEYVVNGLICEECLSVTMSIMKVRDYDLDYGKEE